MCNDPSNVTNPENGYLLESYSHFPLASRKNKKRPLQVSTEHVYMIHKYNKTHLPRWMQQICNSFFNNQEHYHALKVSKNTRTPLISNAIFLSGWKKKIHSSSFSFASREREIFSWKSMFEVAIVSIEKKYTSIGSMTNCSSSTNSSFSNPGGKSSSARGSKTTYSFSLLSCNSWWSIWNLTSSKFEATCMNVSSCKYGLKFLEWQIHQLFGKYYFQNIIPQLAQQDVIIYHIPF